MANYDFKGLVDNKAVTSVLKVILAAHEAKPTNTKGTSLFPNKYQLDP